MTAKLIKFMINKFPEPIVQAKHKKNHTFGHKVPFATFKQSFGTYGELSNGLLI